MTIRFACRHCDKQLAVKDEQAGKKAKCPACQAVVTVPDVEYAEEDERPSRARKSSRRDEDDGDEDDDRREEDDEQEARRRKAARRFAALGIRLHATGTLLYAATFFLAAFAPVMLASAISNKLEKDKGDFKSKPPSKQEIEDAKAATIKMRDLAKHFGLSSVNFERPRDRDLLLAAGIESWSTHGSALVPFGIISALLLAAALILSVVGLAFTVRTPGGPLVLSMAIASLSLTVISVLCMLVAVVSLVGGDGGLCILMPILLLNPFGGAMNSITAGTLASWVAAAVGAVVYVIPLLEIGRLTMFALYQWAVGKAYKDRETRLGGMVWVILVPSVLFGLGLAVFLVNLAFPSVAKARTMDDMPSFWPAAILLALYAMTLAGLLVFYAMSSQRASNTLRYATK